MSVVYILLAAAIAFVLFRASQKPDVFSVARSTTIAAPPASIFPHVNDLHKWDAWSPWAKIDPAAKSSFEGPDAGKGAVMKWDGNCKVGAGSMTITDSRANEHIGINLDFIRPFKGNCAVEFTFKPEAGGTLVTWSMSGKSNFFSKIMSVFMDCEKMTGGYYEKGLASLKAVVESK